MSEQKLELPKGWVNCKFDDITTVVRGGSPRPKGDPRYFGGTIPWIMIADVTKEHGYYISKTKDTVTKEGSKKSRLIKKGSLILTNSASVCIPKILAVDGCIHDGFLSFENLQKNIEIMYTYFFFEYIRPKILNDNRQGNTQVNLNIDIVKKIEIPIPPLNEQKRIVSKIEELFSKIDSTKQSLEQTKLQLEQYRQSLLKSTFEGKLTEKWREVNKDRIEPVEKLLTKILNEQNSSAEENINIEQELPNLPESWIWSSIKTICRNHDHQRIPINAKERKQIQGKIPYYGASGIIDYVEKPIFSGEYFLIGEDGANLISRSTPIAFIVKGEFWVNNHAHILSTYGDIPLEFLVYYIESISLKPWISGSAQPKLNQENLKKIPVPLPPLKEQEQIISQIEQGFSLIENTQNIVNSTLQTLQIMKMSILKQAFEGKLVPQDPNDEPAQILLEKIKATKDAKPTKKRRTKNVK